MSTFDLYHDFDAVPFAVDVTENEAERIENALAAINYLADEKPNTYGIRSNPVASDLDAIESEIAEIVGYLPANDKEAMVVLKEQGQNRKIGQVAKLYKQLKPLQISCFAENVANSFVVDTETQYGVLIESGVVATLVAARYKRFEKLLDQCKTIQFQDLSEGDQNFITSLIEATDVFFDVTSSEDIAAFDSSDYQQTLILFKSDNLVHRIMSILATTNVKNRTSAHYAAPFLKAVYLATEIDDDIDSWMKSPKEGETLNSPYDFFPSRDNLVLDSSACKSLCEKLQVFNIFAPALKLSINFFLQKPDSGDFFGNKKIIQSFVDLDIIQEDEEKGLENKTLQIAYLAIAVSSSQNFSKIMEANYSSYPTAKKMLQGFGPRLGVSVKLEPSIAYAYSTLADTRDFDNYFHWAVNLISAFYNSDTFSGTWYQPTKALCNRLLVNAKLRNEICDFIRYLRKEDVNFRVIQPSPIYTNPFNLKNLDNVTERVDFNKLEEFHTIKIAPEWAKSVREAGFGKVLDTLFPDGMFYNRNALHHIIVGSTFVKNFDKIDKSLRFQQIKSNVPIDFEIYHSTPLNPLSLVMGHKDFYNCCYVVGKQASASALASFYTYDAAGVCTYGFDVETTSGKVFDVMTGYFTSLVKGLVDGENVNVPKETRLDLIEGTTELSLLYANPKMSKVSRTFAKNPNAEKVEMYLFGGSEGPMYANSLKDKNFVKDSAVALLTTLAANPKFIEYTGGFQNMQGKTIEALKAADAEVGYILSQDELRETPYYEQMKDMKYTNCEMVAKAYSEAFPANGLWTSAGLQNIKSASLNFQEMHVYFDEIGGSFSVKYVTEDDDIIELDEINDFNYLLYMFSFPKGNSFVPFQGSVCFHTDADADYCKKLLIPDWFKGKPLKRGNKVLKTKDLVKMRTPLEGAFVENSKGKVVQIL